MEKWGQQKSLDPRDDGGWGSLQRGKWRRRVWPGGQGQTLFLSVLGLGEESLL